MLFDNSIHTTNQFNGIRNKDAITFDYLKYVIQYNNDMER